MREYSDEYMGRVITRYLQSTNGIVSNEKRRFAIQRWKHRFRGADGTLTYKTWEKLANQGRCAWCKKEVPPEELTMDHVMPKALGGGFTPENIVPACESCNRLRGEVTNLILTELRKRGFDV